MAKDASSCMETICLHLCYKEQKILLGSFKTKLETLHESWSYGKCITN